MINMAFMPLYMWEMWEVTPVTHARTDRHWKVVQYSVWAESAISRKAALESNNFKSIIIRIGETANRNVYLQQNMQRKHLLWWYSLGCPQTSCWRRNDIYLLQMLRHSSKEGRVREKVHTIQNAFSLFVFFGKCSFNLLLLLETMLIPISPAMHMNHWRPDKSFHRSSLIDVSTNPWGTNWDQ